MPLFIIKNNAIIFLNIQKIKKEVQILVTTRITAPKAAVRRQQYTEKS
jgi:hypothetical protein